MRLSNLRDEDLHEVSLLKTRKGTATSEAKRAAQILRTRNVTHGGFYGISLTSHLDCNLEREYKTFEEEHGCSLDEYLERERKRR